MRKFTKQKFELDMKEKPFFPFIFTNKTFIFQIKHELCEKQFKKGSR